MLSYYVFTFLVPCCAVCYNFRLKRCWVRLYLQLFACLIYVICVCLRIVVSNTYCSVFLFCLSPSCVQFVVSFSGLSIFDYPFGILYRLFNTRKQNNRMEYHPSDMIDLVLNKYFEASILIYVVIRMLYIIRCLTHYKAKLNKD